MKPSEHSEFAGAAESESNRRGRAGRWLKRGLCIWILAALLIGPVWVGWDSSPRFDISRVADSAELRKLVKLGDELERIERGSPLMADPSTAKAAADWIRLPARSEVRDWRRMLAPGADAQFRHATLNSVLIALAQHPHEANLDGLRAMKPEDAERVILTVARSHLEAQQTRMRNLALSREDFASARRRHQWPDPPRPGWARLALRRLAGRPSDLSQYATALAEDLGPLRKLAAWQDALAKFQEQPMGDPNQAGFWLVRDPSQPIEREGWSARMDVELEYRHPPVGAGQGQRTLVSGLRLNGVSAVPDRNENDEVKPRLSPSSGLLTADVPQFTAFLQSLGLPKHCDLLDMKPRRIVRGELPAFLWDLTLRHQDFESLVWRESFDPGDPSGKDLSQAVRSLVHRSREKLLEHLRTANRDFGWTLTVTETADVARDQSSRRDPILTVSLSSPQLPNLRPIPFAVSVFEDGQASWSENARLADRDAMIRLLARQNPILSAWEERLRLDGLRYRRSGQGVLEGTLTAVSLSEGPSPRFAFTINSQGQAEAVPVNANPTALASASASTSAVKPATRTGRVPPPLALNRSQATDEDVREALETQFPALAPFTECRLGENGRSLALGLRLADYPMLTLGPAPIESKEELPRLLAELLSSKFVRAQSREQWEVSGPSPRWGDARATVKTWSPSQGEAELECRLTIQPERGIHLTWLDRLQAVGDHWSAAKADRLSELLEPRVREVSASVEKYATSVLGRSVQVEVDENAFGPGAWLRLHPPAAAFRCRFEPFPGCGWQVGVDQVMVSPDGIKLNPAYSFRVKMCVPLPPPPSFPVACLCDPTIRINFAERGLGLEAKITPPLLPLPGGTGEDVLTNPWLHLIALEARLYGSLSRRELRGEADLTALSSRKLASGSLFAHFPVQGGVAFKGKLHARESLGSLSPITAGDISADHRGFRARADFQVAGARMSGQLRFLETELEGDSRYRAEFEGEAPLPLVGRVQVRGASDLRFQDPLFEAKGEIPISEQLKARLKYVIQIDKNGVNCIYEWTKPGGLQRVLPFLIPELNREMSDQIEGQLRQAIAETPDGDAPLTAEEQAVIDRVPSWGLRTLPWSGPPNSSSPSPREVESDLDLGEAPFLVRVRDEDARMALEEGRLTIKSKDGAETFVDVPASEVGVSDLKYCVFALWRETSQPGRSAALILDYGEKRATRLRMREPRTIEEKDDLANDLAALGPLFGDKEHLRRDQRAAIALTAAKGHDPNAKAEACGEGGCRIVYRTRSGTAMSSTIWLRSGRLTTAYLIEKLIPPDRHPAIAAKLTRLTPPLDDERIDLIVLASEPTATAELGRTSLLWFRDDRWEVLSDARSDPRSGVWAFRLAQGGGRTSQLAMIQRCAESFGSGKGPSSRSGTVWVGPEGACAAEVQTGRDGWWLYPAMKATAPPSRSNSLSHSPVFLSRQRFAEASESQGLDYWPKDWLDSDFRLRAETYYVAEELIQSWTEAREKGWSAHPMGLLTDLALDVNRDQPPALSQPQTNPPATPRD